MMILTKLAALLVCETESAAAPAGPMAALTQMLPFVLMFGVIYFLLVRPASKQRKEHQALLNALKKDDEVVTSGGVFGRIVSLDERVATLEIADKVKIRILRDRVAGRWDPSSTANVPASNASAHK